MKKLLSLLLATVFMLCAAPVFAAPGDMGLLSAMGVLPAEVNEITAGEAFTRAELAYAAAHLAFGDNLTDVGTKLADSEDHMYSKEIKAVVAFGIMSVDLSGAFRPEGTVTMSELCRVLVDIMGYGEIAKFRGGYPSGYMTCAVQLSIVKGAAVSSGTAITKSDAAQVIYNAATARFNDSVGSSVSDRIDLGSKKNQASLMGKNLGISVYNGEITKVNAETNTATVKITDNKYDTNYEPLEKGSEHSFKSMTVNMSEYEYVPSIIWVNKKEEIVAISPQRNVEVKYGYLYSVNGDVDEKNSYSIAYMSRLSLYGEDEEYDVAEEARMKYNEEMTIAPQKIIGNFMKLVIRDDEVIYMEGWDLEEGGILSTKGEQEMTFIQKDDGMRIMKEIDTYKRKLVFINNAAADIKDLRTNSYVRYYKAKSTLVFVAYEKMITETLGGYSAESLQIGDTIYETEDSGWYYSMDGTKYRAFGTGDVSALIGVNVSGYFNGKDKCVYLRPAIGTVEQTNRFLAMIVGYSAGKGLNQPKMKLMLLETSVGENRVYSMSNKIKLKDGISERELASNAGDRNGNGIYEFELNAKGEIASVAKPLPVNGFAVDTVPLSSFTTDVGYVSINSKNIVYTNAKKVGIYQDNDKWTARELAWSALNAMDAPNVILKLYGYEDSPDVRLAVICGATENIFYYTVYEGLISGKKLTVDEDGEKYYKVSVISSSGESEYRVDYDEGAKLPENAVATYKARNIFGPSGRIDFVTTTELPMTTTDFSWVSGLQAATVYKATKDAVMLEDGSTWFFHPSLLVLVEMTTQKGKRVCKQMKTEELQPGDTVYFKQNMFIMQMIVVR